MWVSPRLFLEQLSGNFNSPLSRQFNSRHYNILHFCRDADDALIWRRFKHTIKNRGRPRNLTSGKVARLDFLGGYFPSLSINLVGMSKDMGRRLPQLCYIKIKFLIIWVLLQSESPWQRNDAITFFIYLCVSLYQEFFLRNRLKEYVPAIIASIMAKFEEILWERFRNILKCSFKNHKNSEIAC